MAEYTDTDDVDYIIYILVCTLVAISTIMLIALFITGSSLNK